MATAFQTVRRTANYNDALEIRFIGETFMVSLAIYVLILLRSGIVYACENL